MENFKIKCLILNPKGKGRIKEKFANTLEKANKYYNNFLKIEGKRKGEINVFLMNKLEFSETYKVVNFKILVNN